MCLNTFNHGYIVAIKDWNDSVLKLINAAYVAINKIKISLALALIGLVLLFAGSSDVISDFKSKIFVVISAAIFALLYGIAKGHISSTAFADIKRTILSNASEILTSFALFFFGSFLGYFYSFSAKDNMANYIYYDFEPATAPVNTILLGLEPCSVFLGLTGLILYLIFRVIFRTFSVMKLARQALLLAFMIFNVVRRMPESAFSSSSAAAAL